MEMNTVRFTRSDKYIISVSRVIVAMLRNASARWLATLVVAGVVCAYYRWQVRAAGYHFEWGQDLGGYYDYLGRALARGRLYLPIQPAPELLALSNPWDPSVDGLYKMHDMAFYGGRYYLYHGPGPAALLFTPWRLLSGHDMPENFALFLLVGSGFLFSCGALLQLLKLADTRPPPALLGLMLLALGICQGAPYLLSRVWVYEVAIGGGYFCISGAWCFLAHGIRPGASKYWLAASGLMFGLAISCRPHLGLAGLAAAAALAATHFRSRGQAARRLGVFLAPFLVAGLLVAAYNYRRFGDPFEFGIRYLLAGVNQNRIRLATGNVLPGLYFLLFCSPEFGPVFPWVRTVLRYPFGSPSHAFPPGYVIESITGALFLAPFAIGAMLVPSARRVKTAEIRILLWTMAASSGAALLFLAATGWTTQRYEVDFLPTATLAAITNLAIHMDRRTRLVGTALRAAFAASVFFGAVVSLALGISGPYDEMLKNRPASYLRIARWFSPSEEFRLLQNPELLVEFSAGFSPQAERFREPLLTIGAPPFRHFLYAEHLAGRLRIVSESDRSMVAGEAELDAAAPVKFQVKYAPETGELTVAVNGREILAQHIGTVITAPAQVTVGENRIADNLSVRRFTGRIHLIRKIVRGS
jgi:hypothetical protein